MSFTFSQLEYSRVRHNMTTPSRDLMTPPLLSVKCLQKKTRLDAYSGLDLSIYVIKSPIQLVRESLEAYLNKFSCYHYWKNTLMKIRGPTPRKNSSSQCLCFFSAEKKQLFPTLLLATPAVRTPHKIIKWKNGK
jgi:hypothetical protein